MSKSTPYSAGSVSINGKQKASTTKRGDTVYANYNMNDSEKALYNYAQKTLKNVVPQVNVFSDEVKKNFQNQLDAYQKKGMNTIDKLYTPLLNNLKTDMASRFGNFNNSMFLNQLNSIEDKRTDAISQLAENLILKQNDLINNELSNRYNYINLLNAIQNQGTSNALNYIASALNSGSSAQGLYNSNGYIEPDLTQTLGAILSFM